MTRPGVAPLDSGHLPEFARLLEQHLDSTRSATQWIRDLSRNWCADRPNYGYGLFDHGKLVGGIGALYADRLIDKLPMRTCNITSWCVLEPYRQQSMRLALALTADPSLTYTDFSPTRVVAAMLGFLKFHPIDARQYVLLNRPTLSRGIKVIGPGPDLLRRLSPEARKIFDDHQPFEWLAHAGIDIDGELAHVIYKATRYKALPAARILYPGAHNRLGQALPALSHYLLMRGFVTTHLDARWLSRPPPACALREGFHPRQFLSGQLSASQIDYLYAETTALDL